VKVTSKGQITIPIEIRERLGLLPGTEVDFVVEGEGVRILRRYSGGEGRGAKIVRRLRGTSSVRMTTKEILAPTRKH